MALSMDEQRILDEIERGLASADPVLATRMASFGAHGVKVTLRLRRLRLVASFLTLLVVAVVSLVVYALVPFRSTTDRQTGGKSSASPAAPAMMAPAHRSGQPSAAASPRPSSSVRASSAPSSAAASSAPAKAAGQARSAASPLPHLATPHVAHSQ
jgi:cytoskeletal protein RodZ